MKVSNVYIVLLCHYLQPRSTRGRYLVQKSESDEYSGGESSSSDHSSTSRELNQEIAKADSSPEEDPEGE